MEIDYEGENAKKFDFKNAMFNILDDKDIDIYTTEMQAKLIDEAWYVK